MVTLPVSSLDCETWKTKHQVKTTITSDRVMDNNVDNMETQQAVDHIPGATSASELQALNEFITAHSEPVQCSQTADKHYEYDPINDCMQLVKQGVGKGKPQESTSTGKLAILLYEINNPFGEYYNNTTHMLPRFLGTTEQHISLLGAH